MEFQPYASRTGTLRNLAVLRQFKWFLLVAALGTHSNEGFPFMMDNSAYSYWTAWMKGKRSDPMFDPAPFEVLRKKLGGHRLATGIVAPDIVCGGAASLELSLEWLPKLKSDAPVVYIPVQPGITPAMLAGIIGPTVGIFVGGTSEWKEATCAAWAKFAHAHGALCHVGRVNTQRRVSICKAAGVDSFDGSSVSRYAVTMSEIQRALRRPAQTDFEADRLDLAGEGLEHLLRSLRRVHGARGYRAPCDAGKTEDDA